MTGEEFERRARDAGVFDGLDEACRQVGVDVGRLVEPGRARDRTVARRAAFSWLSRARAWSNVRIAELFSMSDASVSSVLRTARAAGGTDAATRAILARVEQLAGDKVLLENALRVFEECHLGARHPAYERAFAALVAARNVRAT